MKHNKIVKMSKFRFEITLLLPAAIALGLATPDAKAVVIYAQDFEGSPAADEYATGDFDPVPVIEGSEGVFFESDPAAVQVVDAYTIVNGSPSGAVQVLAGNNSVKFSGNDAPACCQHYQIIPSKTGGSGSAESILTFSAFGVPSSDGDDSQRLVELWANEGGALGVTGGPDFIFELRFDENGSVFYDSEGGWDDSGLTVPINQWNSIVVSSRVDGTSPALRYARNQRHAA